MNNSSSMFSRIFLTTLICASLTGTVLLTGCSGGASESSHPLITSADPSSSSNGIPSSAETPKVTFSEEDTSTDYSESESTVIKLSGKTAEINGSGASMDGSTLKITSAGTYILSGELSDGQVVISAGKKDTVRLVLDNASITSSTAPAIYSEKCGKTILLLKKDTSNTLTDGSSYVSENTEEDSDSPNAAVYCKDDLTILGEGALTVNGNARNGITGKDIVRISGGAITVNASHNGITGRDALAIEGGSITVKTTDGDGLRSTYTDTDKTENGHITIENAAINIEAACDGIQAAKDLSVGSGTITITTNGGAGEVKTQQGARPGFNSNQSSTEESRKGLKAGSNLSITGGTVTVDSCDDAIHSNGDVFIKNGTLDIKAGDDGIHADSALSVSGGSITISQSYEGFEAIAVDISGGVIDITSSDDGINAAGGNDGSGFGGFDGNMDFGGRQGPGGRGNFQPGQQPGDMPSDFQPSNLPSDFQPGDMPSDFQPGDMPSDFQPGDMPSDFQPGQQSGNTPPAQPSGSNNENTQSEQSSGSTLSTAVNISGGTLYINSQGDGLDSNSALNISGGTIVINGTTQGGNGIIDHDGSCAVTGGLLIGTGTSDMLEMPGETSTQKTAVFLFDQTQQAGTLVYVSDSKGNILAAIAPEKTFSCVILSSPDLKEGETYTVFTGGTASGDSTHGYYSKATVTGGTQFTTFTASDTVTYVNKDGVTSYSGGFGGGMRGGNMNGGRNNRFPSDRSTSQTSVV